MKFTLFFSAFVLACLLTLFPSQQLIAQDAPNKDAASERVIEGPSLEIMETQIDLGTIAPETKEIVGTIHIFNQGTKPLEVYKVDGPCACFAGYEGDEVVQPQEGGMLLAKFEKSKIPAGDVTRMVRVKTNDPVNDAVEVKFSFTVQRGEMEEQLRLLREELTRVRKEVTHVRNDLEKVLDKMNIEPGHSKKKKPVDTTVYDVNIGVSPTLGPADAPVTIVEFSDFECIYCAREFPRIKKMLNDYPGKLRVVFKHYPLKFHKKAKPAHAAAELAFQEQGNNGFWQMHDMIFANPKDLEIATLRGYAETLGLDMKKFDEVINDPEQINNMLQADYAEAKKCKVTGTPTVMINGLKLAGNRSIGNYKARIDRILAASEKTRQTQ
ncbi:MAG: thioredoxin domain-containing protein [Planctomycetota bacterium]|jgi:protein-disulfide isomerase